MARVYTNNVDLVMNGNFKTETGSLFDSYAKQRRKIQLY